jgi:aryl-alcohol dehydrogenase-like predicted oxidoreductase
MKFNEFGPERERLSALGLGCSKIGSFNNAASHADIWRTLDRAMELGVNVFDTADVYGQGDSERTLGRFLRGRRQKAFVVSKVGKRFSLKMRLARPLKPLLRPLIRQSAAARSTIVERRNDNIATDFKPAYLAKAVEGSLKRLRFESLDALLLHSPHASDLIDRDLEPMLGRLKRDGKIRHYGVSCDDMPSLTKALELDALTLLELPLDLIESARLTSAWSAISARRIGVIAREVIRFRPTQSPAVAVSEVLRSGDITCVVAGTSQARHLTELATGVI